jgi:hypothetical protein
MVKENIAPCVIPETAQRLSGIQYFQWACSMACWIPGSAFSRPGMTTYLLRFNKDLKSVIRAARGRALTVMTAFAPQ